MAKQKPSTKKPLLWRLALTATLLAAAVYVLIANWRTVRSGLQAARHAEVGWLGLSVLCMMATCAIAAAIYGLLALHRLRWRQTLLIEVAATFVNRLLPSGVGGLGLHGLYLYRRGHTAAEATVVVSVNNLLGITAHLALLVVVVAVRPGVLTRLHAGGVHVASWQPVAIIAAVVAGMCLVAPVRRRLLTFVSRLLAGLRRIRPIRLLAAAVLAMLLTATYTAILVAAERSVGITLGLLPTFVVFSIGMLVANVTPTPGGLVGAEAGLFAGLTGYGVAATEATAAVLIFRLASYWLPLIPGVFALLFARRRKLV